MNRVKKIILPAAWVGWLIATAPVHADPASFTGSYTNTFDSLGVAGTTMPPGFRAMTIAGSSSTYDAANPISADGIASATASGAQTLIVWNSGSAVVSSSSSLFNVGSVSNVNDRALGSDAAGVAAMVIELSLTNNTGSNLLRVVFNYDVKVLTNGIPGTEAGELPGYAFFFSATGGTTAAEWTRVGALSLPNSTQGSTLNSGDVTITFPVLLTNNGRMFFRWADDNAQGVSPDQMIAIDNISVIPSTDTSPAVTLTSPTNGTMVHAPADIFFSATANDADGTVTNVAFYSGATKLADVTTAPFNFTWNGVGEGYYAFRAVATDDSGLSATSSVANVSIGLHVTRGPYLQLSTPTSIVIRWRTDLAESSRVLYGTTAGDLNLTNVDEALVTEHIVTLTNLSPDTNYFYAIGTLNVLLNGPDPNLYFLTHPLPGSPKPLRLWVIGDAGTGSGNQMAVRDAFYNLNGGGPVDGWLQLGDNAYNSGLDSEFQANMFNIYTNLLRHTVTWPTLGNHETAGATAFVDTYAHFQVFTLPTAGEAGGVPSGTEHYYSFDLGMAHFVCLDSMTADRSTNGAMATWLRTDLAMNTNRWLVAYWHHPPYSKGSHNSDTETELIQMRQTFNPILEAGGADLVLSGHSHSYERSYLINGHYGVSATFTTNMIVQPGSGRETNGVGAYLKPETLAGNPIGSRGAIYSVVGSSGQLSGGSLNHAAHFVSLNNLGSMVLDITTNRLDAIFLRETGETNDYFTIIKTNFAPSAQNATFVRGSGLPLQINIADLIAAKTSDANSNTVFLQAVGSSGQGALISTNEMCIFYDPANNSPDSFSYTVNDGHGGTTNATINVIVVNPGGISQQIFATDGVVNIDFAGIPGFEYEVQHSTNLVTWTVRTNLVAPPDGLFQFMESNPPSPSFYRLRKR